MSESEKCCLDPDIRGREAYVGGELDYGYQYCKSCDAEWKINKSTGKYERVVKENKPMDNL